MKKFIATIAAIIVAGFSSSTANAALTTSPAGDNRSVYVINDYSGDISRLDLTDESTELVCESAISSTDWITGSAFDPATNTVYWIKDFSTGNAAIVTVNLYSCDQSVAPIDLGGRGDTSNANIYGLTWHDGVIEILYMDGDTFYDRIRGEATLVDGVWEVTQLMDYGNETNFSDLAYDPVSHNLYAMSYDCNVYNLENYPSAPMAAYTAAGISTDCPTLKIDDAGRVWFTSNSYGVLNSDTLSAPGVDLQSFNNGSLDFSVYCEEFFFAPTVIPAPGSNEDLAKTGTNVNLGMVFGTAGLFFAAAIAFATRARRLNRQ